MPTLKQLACHVEWPVSNIPFREYGISYGDGIVESHIAIPPGSTPFAISLKSKGFISSGLAMFVFMDGVYQCNRNRCDLKFTERTDKDSDLFNTVEFRVRQKEECLPNGDWIGRPWRFEPLNIVRSSSQVDAALSSHFDHLGTIHILVLRCLSDTDMQDQIFPSVSPYGSMSPESATALMADDEQSSQLLGRIEDEPSLRLTTLFDGSGDEPDSSPRRSVQYVPRRTNVDPPDDDEPRHKRETRIPSASSWKQQRGCVDLRTLVQQRNTNGHSARVSRTQTGSDCQVICLSPDKKRRTNVNISSGRNLTPFDTVGHVSTSTPVVQSQNPYTPAISPIVLNINPVPPFHAQAPVSRGCRQRQEESTEIDDSINDCYVISNGHRVQGHNGWHYHESPERNRECDQGDIDNIHNFEGRKAGPGLSRSSHSRNNRQHDGWDADSYQGNSSLSEAWNSRTPGDCQNPSRPPMCTELKPDSKVDSPSEEKNDWTTGSLQMGYDKDTGWEMDNDQNNDQWKNDDAWGTDNCQNSNQFETDNDWTRPDKNGSQSGINDWPNNQPQLSEDINNGPETNKGDSKKQDADKDNIWTPQSNDGDKHDPSGKDTWNNNSHRDDSTGGINWPSNSYRQKVIDENSHRLNNGKFNIQPLGGQTDWQTQQGRVGLESGTEQMTHQEAFSSSTQSEQLMSGQMPITFVSPMVRRSDRDEPFLYTVPSSVAESRLLSHQVHLGNTADYIHKVKQPKYIDSLEEPYAKFVFKYRIKETIEQQFGIMIERDANEERNKLENVSKDELIARLLRAEGFSVENCIFPSSGSDGKDIAPTPGDLGHSNNMIGSADPLSTHIPHGQTGDVAQEMAANNGTTAASFLKAVYDKPGTGLQSSSNRVPTIRSLREINTAEHGDSFARRSDGEGSLAYGQPFTNSDIWPARANWDQNMPKVTSPPGLPSKQLESPAITRSDEVISDSGNSQFANRVSDGAALNGSNKGVGIKLIPDEFCGNDSRERAGDQLDSKNGDW